ncbi:hypothetical protein [Psychroflexus sediminis]|uniref:Uncharacterized protein n=1 Tax=Psychroflexus sediminis TaxID=470826 RepID=A0A1G7V8R5_9FLAO|nr:hypothetical protein [Psychroflexus sediminis]SDG55921.1 hypothetical protein SAMN04488027_103143 [Psychroflexus sediminis]
MDVIKQESGEARMRSKALVKRFALRGGAAFVVLKDIKISLAFFGSFLGDAKKNENFNFIEILYN